LAAVTAQVLKAQKLPVAAVLVEAEAQTMVWAVQEHLVKAIPVVKANKHREQVRTHLGVQVAAAGLVKQVARVLTQVVMAATARFLALAALLYITLAVAVAEHSKLHQLVLAA
jgi:hypothetical protein